ncbi:MAG: M48 family metallopeptidase [Verrucomicrobiia bacterium]
MMDFFERQERAKKKTSYLIFLFVLAVIAIDLTIYSSIALFLRQQEPLLFRQDYFNLQLFLIVTITVLSIIIGGSLWKIANLSRGGGCSVAAMLGGQPLNLHTTDPAERRLINVVEEMAIASGVPMPEIYILDQEKTINAFAAGHLIQNAVIGVTRGSVQQLSRDELQGVIAHEFSHILNGDMRLNLRLMGVLNGILLLAIIGYYLLRSSSRRTYYRSSSSSSEKKGGNPLPLIGLLLLVVGYIGVFFAKLIKAAVSRQREFLADAAAVQFTRNPLGLAGALKKIGNTGSRLHSPHAEEASHLFFGNGVGEQWLQLMATHPPLKERIQALDPAWDGKLLETQNPEANNLTEENLTSSLIATPAAIPVEQTLSHIGTPTHQHAQYAATFRANIPLPIQTALHESSGACAVILALLLSEENMLRKHQIEMINSFADSAVAKTVQQLSPHILTLEASAKLPLVELALPALKLLSPVQYQDFKTLLDQLIHMDGQVGVFEFVLQKIVQNHLDFLLPTSHKKKRVTSFSWEQEVKTLISVLARVGADNDVQAQQAFIKGCGIIEENDQNPTLLSECGLQRFNLALDRIATISPAIKKKIILACAETISADGLIKIEEGELLRAISHTLECPIPPLLSA